MIPKNKPIRSKKIRQSAKGEICSLRVSPYCDYDQSVVLCHIGKDSGVGTKCNDTFSVYGCYECHRLIDTKSKESYAVDKLRALEETQNKFHEKKLIEVK
jgi:hypothetical protein